jgi:hypothetical protein
VSEAVWTFRRRGKSLAPTGNQNVRHRAFKQLAVLTVVSPLVPYANEVYSCECPVKEDLPHSRREYGLLHLSTRTVCDETSSFPVREHGGSCSTHWMVENFLSNTAANPFINIPKLRSVIWKSNNITLRYGNNMKINTAFSLHFNAT